MDVSDDRFVVNFEIAYGMLIQYSARGIDHQVINSMLELLGEGCVSVMKEYIGTRNGVSPKEYRDIDNEYIPAIERELSKIGIFDMNTCRIHSNLGSGSGFYTTISITVDLSRHTSNINYLKLKNPKFYSALMNYTVKNPRIV